MSSPAPFAAPAMTTCACHGLSKTTPKLTLFCFRAGKGSKDPPAYITTYRTQAGGDDCSRRLFP
jgi:hypothetical protein